MAVPTSERTWMRRSLGGAALVAALAVLAAACGGTKATGFPSPGATLPTASPTATGTATESPAPATSMVEVVNDQFNPREITIAAGATVVWEQTGTNPHTVTADDESFDSHPDCKVLADQPKCLNKGDEFKWTFDAPGTIAYYCRIHGAPGGAGMAGTITVR